MHKALGFVDVVKELYANMVGMKEKTVYVRGKWISFRSEKIDQTFNLNKRKNGSEFKKLVKELDFQKNVDLLSDGKRNGMPQGRIPMSPLQEER